MPENVDIIASRKLRNLSQTGLVRDSVRAFKTCMLEIPMSRKDKLFQFLEGLKPWACTELNRQGVDTLCATITAAKQLVDYMQQGNDKNKNMTQRQGT